MNHSSVNSSARFTEALALANELHRNQTRKGTDIPYISHLLIVCGTVIEHGGNEDVAIAALLHDAVEDQGGLETLERIESVFGRDIARMVRSCSDSFETPKRPWRERKEEYLKHLRSAKPEVILISLTDKLHNLKSIVRDYHAIQDSLWARFNAGQDEILWYYKSLLDVFEGVNANPVLLVDFRNALAELEREVLNQRVFP